ncbi:HAD-IIIC family phosphatase [Streptomyces sp. NPDC001135]
MTAEQPAPTVKCLVWDLDDTLWDGTVLEGDGADPRPAAVEALRTLDRRGVLHAVASRGDHDTARAHLARHGLEELFTVLDIGWGDKSEAVRRIADTLGIALDTVAFIDNDPVERAEVAAALPLVRCYAAQDAGRLTGLPEFQVAFPTREAGERRLLYRSEWLRRRAQQEHTGAPAAFLASLGLVLTVRRAAEADLHRARELTVRTHQLNTTGRTYDLEELRTLCGSSRHEVLVADLEDRFGSYGTIGLALVEHEGDTSVLKLLLLSCRVMSRGVGPAFLGHVVRETLAAGRRPAAEFVPTDVNRVMLVNLRFGGFEVAEQTDGRLLLRYAGQEPPAAGDGPVRVVVEEARRLTVGVVGAGTMGTGIAQCASEAGFGVVVVDRDPQALTAGPQRIRDGVRLARLLRGPRRADGPEPGPVRWSEALDELSGADVVIECVRENIPVKEALFRELDGICPPGTVFATCTSAVPVARLAAVTRRPGRVIGTHFMNPAHIKDTVEVIRGAQTAEDTLRRTLDLLSALGKKAIVVQDAPGFVSNRVLMATINDAATVLQEGTADAETVDRVFQECFGHAMGPLRTADLIGLDTVLDSLHVLLECTKDQRYTPCTLLADLVRQGHVGRKGGRGFHSYVR